MQRQNYHSSSLLTFPDLKSTNTMKHANIFFNTTNMIKYVNVFFSINFCKIHRLLKNLLKQLNSYEQYCRKIHLDSSKIDSPSFEFIIGIHGVQRVVGTVANALIKISTRKTSPELENTVSSLSLSLQ